MHETTKLRTEVAHIGALCRDGTRWCLLWSEYESFRAAWTNGRAFWDGIDVWEQHVTIKLADIVGLIAITDDSLALRAEEDEEIARRKLLDGRDS